MTTKLNALKSLKAELQLITKGKPSRSQLYKRIVNAPFLDKCIATPLGLGVIVLLTVDYNNKLIIRQALSETEQAQGAVEYSVKKFEELNIPLAHKTNIISKAINSRVPQHTQDWHYLFTPELTKQESHFNQAGAGISFSFVHPFEGTKPAGALIFSYFIPFESLSKQHHEFMNFYTKFATKQVTSVL